MGHMSTFSIVLPLCWKNSLIQRDITAFDFPEKYSILHTAFVSL